MKGNPMKKSPCILLSLLFILMMTGCSQDDTDPEIYEAFAEKNSVMPIAEELGEYKDFHTLCHHQSSFPFGWDAYILIAEYYFGNYEKVKTEVIGKYTFEKASILDKTDKSIETVFFTDGYQFRMLSILKYRKSEDDEFPEDFYLIGFNDDGKKIAYIYFTDPDLDTIEDFPQFLSADSGWDKMKNK